MKARIVPVSLDEQGLAHIAEAAKLLAEGGLVAFPTETVYGIGCNAQNPAAVERLKQVKRRPSDKEFSLHIASADDVRRYVESVPPMADQLMRRYWPGPLTIVFPGNQGKGVALRIPSNRFALELIRRANVPVFAPSANRSGEPPAKTAREVAQTLGDDLDLILDGGTTTLKEASTVLRVTDVGWEILRKGSITEDMIRRTLGKTLVFVCTANSCRSPMAEALCKKLLADRLGCEIEELPARGYVVLSAGTAASWDLPASYQAVEAMQRYGLDISGHASRPLTPGLIEDAEIIFVMARHHADSICSILPEARAKIRLLDPNGYDVPDPVGASVETFEECAGDMLRHLQAVIDIL